MDEAVRAGTPRLTTVIRTYALLIAACGILAGIVVFAGYEVRTPRYAASAEVFFRTTNLDAAVLNGSSFFNRQDDPARQAATNLELAGTPAVADRVATALGAGLTRDEVLADMSFAQRGDSDIVAITATDADPQRATDLANTWAREFVAFRQETDQAQVEGAIARIRDELTDLRGASPTVETEARQRDLGASLSRLRVVQSLQTGGVEFLEAATVPESPTGIPRRTAIVAGVVLGLLIGLGGAYVAARADRRVKRTAAMSDGLALPLLATVPSAPGRRGTVGPNPCEPTLPVEEAFKTLGVRLKFFNIDSDRQVVAVVSGQPNDGKTLVSTHMAATSALAGRRTLLIDCDLRRGDAAARLGMANQPGLVQVLSGQAMLSTALQRVTALDTAVARAEASPGRSGQSGGLWVLANGPIPPNAVQMLSSEHMAALLHECRDRFDQIILDTAPLLRVSDAEPLLAEADGFVVVTRLMATTYEGLSALRAVVDRHRDRALGVVVNDVSPRADNASGYGYDRRDARDPQAV